MNQTYLEFAILLLLCAGCGALAVRLRQPLILAFILVGIMVGPAGFGWVRAHDQIDLLAQIGVTILLFVVGLKLDLHLVRHLGPVALATGLGQLAFTIVIGFLIALALDMPALEATYVAVALTFSSTIIVVKLLSDKREIDSLHGRIAMGFLIVQDIAVVMAMMVLGSLAGREQPTGLLPALFSVATRLLVGGLAIALLMRYVLPRIMAVMARSQDLLLLFCIAWGTALAAAGELFGFSKEVGAFLAGFSLASTPFRASASARLTSVRDFLLLFFFIDLGSRLELSILGDQLFPAAALSVFVLVGNPLIVMAIMGFMGYRKRTGFLAGLTVAQISEFSIVFVAMGITLGHVDLSTLALITLVGLITITSSTYMILHSQTLYGWLAPWLGLFERRRPMREMAVESTHPTGARTQVIVFGLGRYGSRIMQRLRERNVAVLGVDFDPEVVMALRRSGCEVRFGNAEDPDFPAALPLEKADAIVSTLPQLEVNRVLLQALAVHGYRGSTMVTAHTEDHARALRRAGATRVLLPSTDAADFATVQLLGKLGLPEQ